MAARLEIRVDECADGERRQRERDQSAFFDLLLLRPRLSARARRPGSAAAPGARHVFRSRISSSSSASHAFRSSSDSAASRTLRRLSTLRDVGLDPALELEKRGRRLYPRASACAPVPSARCPALLLGMAAAAPRPGKAVRRGDQRVLRRVGGGTAPHAAPGGGAATSACCA